MTITERPEHMWIPPPPLPEFYLPKDKLEKLKKAKEASSSSSSSGTNTGGTEGTETVRVTVKEKRIRKRKKDEEKEQQPAVAGDGAYDGLPPPYRSAGVTPPPPGLTGNDVPPLAIYHICRICLRPRSGKYHREHPIPINGVPPPPGICRRCRVTSVTESSEASELDISDVDEVVRKGRSNEIKIGLIAPFVPDDAMVSNEEAKRMDAQRYLRGRSRERHLTVFREASADTQRRYRRSKSRRSDIIYRHVRVIEEPAPKTRRAQDSTDDSSTTGDAASVRRHVRYERKAEKMTATYGDAQTGSPHKAQPSLKKTNLAKLDSTKASKSVQPPGASTSLDPAPTRKSGPETVYLKRPERTDSDIRRIASEEARKYATDAKKSVRLESKIRRIAHEEVERYREAERKLEARPGAFAHGRLVRVRPQIETKPEASPPKPWENITKASAVTVEIESGLRETVPVRSAASTSSSSKSRSRSDREPWGPQWRRELSLERRRSIETEEERWRVDVAEETKIRVSAAPSGLTRSKKSSSTYDVLPDGNASARATKGTSTEKEPEKTCRRRQRPEEENMGLLFPPPRSQGPHYGYDRDRETVERISVHRRPSTSQREDAPAVSGNYRVRGGIEEPEVVRSAVSRSSTRWQTSGSGGTTSSSNRSGSNSGERGSAEHAAFLLERKKALEATDPPIKDVPERSERRPASNVQYEYKLHTVRPANRPGDMDAVDKASGRRSSSPSHATLEIWQQVPTDPVQRAREASKLEKDRSDAVEWLKSRMDDPKAQVGIDADGSRRFACSIPHRGADDSRPRSSPKPQHKSQKRVDSPQRRSSREDAAFQHSRPAGPRGGGNDKNADLSDREIVVEVWEQVPVEEAARRRHDAARARARGDGDPDKEYVIEAWKQVPSSRPTSSNVRRDSAMDMPPARRWRERREHQRRSEDSAHVKFSSKVDISPTPPGSEESSNAFQRFHDFVGRKSARQQIDGHDSDETGEDHMAEYERRGRLRSRESGRRKSEQVYTCRPGKSRDRDETVRPPRAGQRRYDGRRDERWRPLQRALSESPSREWGDRKRSSVSKGGPPYHDLGIPEGSMAAHDGSREDRRRR